MKGLLIVFGDEDGTTVDSVYIWDVEAFDADYVNRVKAEIGGVSNPLVSVFDLD